MTYVYDGPNEERIVTRIFREGNRLLAIDAGGHNVIERVNEPRLRQVLTDSGMYGAVPAYLDVPNI